jgi:hypothetical protein
MFPRVSVLAALACPLPPTLGVGQPVNHAVRPSSAFVGTLSHCDPSFQSRVVGVGHAARCAAASTLICLPDCCLRSAASVVL